MSPTAFKSANSEHLVLPTVTNEMNLSCFPGFELEKFDENLTQLLAWQRLQQLLPSKSNSSQLLGNTSIGGASISSCNINSGTSGKKGLLNTYLSQQSKFFGVILCH